jgi:hypothetical protein
MGSCCVVMLWITIISDMALSYHCHRTCRLYPVCACPEASFMGSGLMASWRLRGDDARRPSTIASANSSSVAPTVHATRCRGERNGRGLIRVGL